MPAARGVLDAVSSSVWGETLNKPITSVNGKEVEAQIRNG
jgi:hypothetical protein